MRPTLGVSDGFTCPSRPATPGVGLTTGESMFRHACKFLLLAREDFKSDKPEVLASGRCMSLAVATLLTEAAGRLAGNGAVDVQSERRLYEFMAIKLRIASENTDPAVVGEVYTLLTELRGLPGVLPGDKNELEGNHGVV